MNNASFLPTLSAVDVEQVSVLIQSAYTPGGPIEQQRKLQQELFEVQKRPQAWGLVVSLLGHADPNVQFFGAHTAQVKIARDWESFPSEHALGLRDVLLDVAGSSAAASKNIVALRKLFVAISSLALKLVPGTPSKWPDWILFTVTSLSGHGASRDVILEFLSITAEEVASSDLLASSKFVSTYLTRSCTAQMQQSLIDAIPVVKQAVIESLASSGATEHERRSAFRCLLAWITFLPADDLTSIIPMLIQLLSNESTFVGASDVLQEIMTSSVLSDGAGSKTLTEPLLAYLSQGGAAIVQQTLTAGLVDDISHSLCKLLVALGEHSISYFAANITTTPTQTFLRLLFSYTSLPGHYGVDEDESEMTLSFWYLLQEALWTAEYPEPAAGGDQWAVANALYLELVVVLKRKVTWPSLDELTAWTRDQKEKFQIYRRDVADTLINAYYILRMDMFRRFVEEVTKELSTAGSTNWENIEAILHCIMSIQEAAEVEENPHLDRLFGPDILGRLPTTGLNLVRKTALGLIGAYASWFPHTSTALLLNALNYVVEALTEPSLCLPAANALRDLCDANRVALAPHVAAFGELHARLPSIPDSEKTKVIQSISSVIQALPPEDEIQPVEAIVSPVVTKLSAALSTTGQLPEETRMVIIQQIQTLVGCARGLTRTSDVFAALEESPQVQEETAKVQRAREDPRMVRLRLAIVQSIEGTMALLADDVTTADALSDLLKSITALPADMTLLSLPPAPLLSLVCNTIQRHPNAIWLSLAGMLINQLNPPVFFTTKPQPSPEAENILLSTLPVLLDATLRYLEQEGMMVEHAEVAQALFKCIEMVVQHFPATLFRLPSGALDALVRCAVAALSLQERYALVAAMMFLNVLIIKTAITDALNTPGKAFMHAHGESIMRAVLVGITGGAPSSTTQNLIELLSTMVSKYPEECKVWIPEILFAPDFAETRATPEAKTKFAKTVLGSRSLKRTREAAQQFALVAKGLEGSSFGYASFTM